MRAIAASLLFMCASNLSALTVATDRVTELQLERVAANIELYRRDCNRLPTTAEFPSILLSSDAACWSGPYLSENQSKDYWGRTLIYRHSQGEAGFTLKSLGIDGKEGTEDDIVFGDNVKAWRSVYRATYVDDTLPGRSIVVGGFVLSLSLLVLGVGLRVYRKIKRGYSDRSQAEGR